MISAVRALYVLTVVKHHLNGYALVDNRLSADILLVQSDRRHKSVGYGIAARHYQHDFSRAFRLVTCKEIVILSRDIGLECDHICYIADISALQIEVAAARNTAYAFSRIIIGTDLGQQQRLISVIIYYGVG